MNDPNSTHDAHNGQAECVVQPDRPIKVVTIVEGGVVQGDLGSRPDIEFEVFDRDNLDCAEQIDGEREAEAEERLTQECPHTIY